MSSAQFGLTGSAMPSASFSPHSIWAALFRQRGIDIRFARRPVQAGGQKQGQLGCLLSGPFRRGAPFAGPVGPRFWRADVGVDFLPGECLSAREVDEIILTAVKQVREIHDVRLASRSRLIPVGEELFP